jgi:hypothetical protein
MPKINESKVLLKVKLYIGIKPQWPTIKGKALAFELGSLNLTNNNGKT